MSSTAVDIAALRYSWTPGVPVLDIPSLTVATGERLFLQGPSGSGKSTLLGILGGVLVPESGTVHVLGTDLAALRPAARDRFRADHVGFVFQMFNLLPYLTVVDNVTLAGAFSGRRQQRAGRDADDEAKRLLSALGLGDAGNCAGRPGSCPWASSSASRPRGPCSAVPSCSSRTSRPRRSIPRRGNPSSHC